MKLIIAVAAVVAGTSILAVSTPAAAQGIESKKSRFAVAKCNNEFAAKGRGAMNARSAGAVLRRSCIQGLPEKVRPPCATARIIEKTCPADDGG
jgi:hypothetical protein